MKEVQPVPQPCRFCGTGPWFPRQDQTYDRYQRATIVEAVWICGQCGNLFDRGVLSVKKDEEK